MLESAVELTEGRLTGQDVKTLIDLAKEMLNASVELLSHVSEVIPQLAKQYPLMVITKGDLLDQETKIHRSGLGHYFREIESSATRSVAPFAHPNQLPNMESMNDFPLDIQHQQRVMAHR